MACYLCGNETFTVRSGQVRDDPNAKIHQCTGCGLVFLTGVDRKDISEFYQDGGMHGSAKDSPPIDHWLKETAHDDNRRFEYLRQQITNKSVLDFGCGAGGFLIRAKSVAGTLAGVELEERLAPHFKQHGLEVRTDITNFPPEQKFDVITAFHVVEHLSDPRAMLSVMKKYVKASGKVILEVPSAEDALLTLYESDAFSRFTYWSCHLYLFNAHTLALLAKQAGLRLQYIKHVQRYPLSNHLHWLAKGKPGGHEHWSFLDSPELTAAYQETLASIGKTDTIMACLTP